MEGGASSSQPKLARRANLISILAAAASTSALAAAFLTNDFRLAYVACNSARSLPLIYKLSAVWAGQSGSLLLWLLILSLFSLAVQRSCRLRAELRYTSQCGAWRSAAAVYYSPPYLSPHLLRSCPIRPIMAQG